MNLSILKKVSLFNIFKCKSSDDTSVTGGPRNFYDDCN